MYMACHVLAFAYCQLCRAMCPERASMILAWWNAGADVWRETVTEASTLAALPLPLALLPPPPIYAALKRKEDAGGWSGAASRLGPPRVRVPGGVATQSKCVGPRQGQGADGIKMLGRVCAAWWPLSTSLASGICCRPLQPAVSLGCGAACTACMQRARLPCGL